MSRDPEFGITVNRDCIDRESRHRDKDVEPINGLLKTIFLKYIPYYLALFDNIYNIFNQGNFYTRQDGIAPFEQVTTNYIIYC